MKGLTISLVLLLSVVNTKGYRNLTETSTKSTTNVDGFFALLKKAFYKTDKSPVTPPASFSPPTTGYKKTELIKTDEVSSENEEVTSNSTVWPQDVFHAIYESILFRKISLDFLFDTFNETIDVNSTENLPSNITESSVDDVIHDFERNKMTTRRRNGRRKFGAKKRRTTVSSTAKSEKRDKSTVVVTPVSFSGVTPADDWYKRTKRNTVESTSVPKKPKKNEKSNSTALQSSTKFQSSSNDATKPSKNFTTLSTNAEVTTISASNTNKETEAKNSFSNLTATTSPETSLNPNSTEVSAITVPQKPPSTDRSVTTPTNEPSGETTISINTTVNPTNSTPVVTTSEIITSTESCIVGNITKFEPGFDGNELFVNVSPNIRNLTYNLTIINNLSRKLKENSSDGITILKVLGPVTACELWNVTLTVQFCENDRKSELVQTGIDESITRKVSDIVIESKSQSRMEIRWQPPDHLPDDCKNYPIRYSVSLAPIGQNTIEHSFETTEEKLIFPVKLYHQKYTVCVTVSFISNANKTYERIHEGEKECKDSSESSPGVPSAPIITGTTFDTTWIEVNFKDPEKPKGDIHHFEYMYCELSKTNCSSWINISEISEKTVKISKLDPCTIYNVSIRGVNWDFDNSTIHGKNETITNTTETTKPSVIENITVTSSATSIHVKWDKEKTRCKVNYTVNLTPGSNCYSDIISLNGTNAVMLFESLTSYTNFTVNITASNEIGSTFNDSTTAETGYSSPPETLLQSNCTSIQCNFTWNIPKHLPGPISYSINLTTLNNSLVNTNETEEFTENEHCSEKTMSHSFHDLEPDTTYNASITTIVNGTNATNSIETSTRPDVPDEAENFEVNCNGQPGEGNGTVNWTVPKKTNGQLEKFRLSCFGTRPGKENHDCSKTINSTDNKKNYTETIKLKPEFEYKFTIEAKTKNVSDFGQSVEKHCNTSALEPKFSQGNPPEFSPKNYSIDSIVITLNISYFPDDNGKIINYSITIQQTHSKDSYRASPENWNPFESVANDDMCCNATTLKETIHCVIGCNKSCETNASPCNRPLLPSTDYSIYVSFCNAAGCVTESRRFQTQPRVQSPDPPPESSSAALAVSLVFITLAIIAGFFIYYRRDNVKKWWQEHRPRRMTPRSESVRSGEDFVIENLSNTRPVKLTEFSTHYNEMSRDSSLKFSVEYEELKAISPAFPITAAQLNENRTKNRWINVLPFDHSRVKLLPISDDITTDYINACYIPGFNSQREYIATQGPLPGTKDDFWRMVWEQSSQVIIMVTQCVERGKVKCETYWPEDRDVHHYADIAIRLRSESVLSNFTIRIFDLNLGTKSLEVKQMHFTKWPDFGCPENTELLLDFIQAVREHSPHGFVGPFTVHCSAGIGRTGTYIAVDRLMQHVQKNHTTVDIYGLVLEMRQHRVNMVQTEDQYVYIHSCLKDLLESLVDEEEEPLYENVTTEPEPGQRESRI